MSNLFYISQILSKNNIFQKLNIDICNYIDNIILSEKNEAEMIIQNYYKKYLHLNFIPNLINFCEIKYYKINLTELDNKEMFNRLNNLNKNVCFKTIVKCYCCDRHNNINKYLQSLNFENAYKYIQDNYTNIINISDYCNCVCNIASTIYCQDCFNIE